MRISTISAIFFLFALIDSLCARNLQHERNNLHHILPKSRGRPFPQPQSYISTETQHTLDERAFAFQYVQGSVVCDLLSSAFNRYYKIIFKPQNFNYARGVSVQKMVKNMMHHKEKNLKEPILKRVVVNVRQPCVDYPSLESDESCKY